MAVPFADVRVDANGVKSGEIPGEEMSIMMLGAGVSSFGSCITLGSQRVTARSRPLLLRHQIQGCNSRLRCWVTSCLPGSACFAVRCFLYSRRKGRMLSLFSCNAIDSSTSWTGLPLMRFSSLSPFALCCSCCFSLCFLFFCLAFMWIMLLRCHTLWRRYAFLSFV